MTILVESEAVGNIVELLLLYKDEPLDPEFEYTSLSDELLELLEGCSEHPCNDLYGLVEEIRGQLERIGVGLEYAEAVSVIPALNMLLIHFELTVPFDELLFQNWSELFVRGLAREHSRDGLQKRQAPGDPGL